jgi:FtsZ-binding cell division protein ZapB
MYQNFSNEELRKKVILLERDVERTYVLQRELDHLRSRYEKDMIDNKLIIERLKASVDDSLRYRPPVDDRHMYDKHTVDILAGGPPKTEVIIRNDPGLLDKCDLLTRHCHSMKEENNLLVLEVQEAQGEIDRLRSVLERLRNSDRQYLESCSKGISCKNCEGRKKTSIYAEACGANQVGHEDGNREEKSKSKPDGSPGKIDRGDYAKEARMCFSILKWYGMYKKVYEKFYSLQHQKQIQIYKGDLGSPLSVWDDLRYIFFY